MSEQTNDVTIGLADIRMCVSIIDLCAKRGAFEGTELSLVGDLRGKLAEFVNAHVPPEQTEESEEGAAE